MDTNGMLLTALYSLIGLTGAASVVAFIWGFVEYITKIGLPAVRRDKGIHIMEWGVGFVITSIVLIALLHLIQRWIV